MRLLLIFPPPASPTYVPLGLASLTAFLRTQTPELDLTVFDLNISTWQFYAKNTPAGNDLLAFMHSHESFYDPVQYTRHQSTWADVNQRVQRLLAHARHYLNSGLWSDELQWFLDIVLQQIQPSSPDLLGFSVMFLEQMAPALALCRRLHETLDKHKRPHCVLGGAALSAVQIKDLMQYAWFVDTVLMGEGETALSQLCQGIPPDQIPGLITRTTGHRPSPSPQDIELTTLPIPDFRDLPLADYANPEPVLPVVLSRHCAWARCRFCAHNVSFGNHRLKTINQFIQELEVLNTRHHCRRFYLADQYVPTSVLMELTTALLQRPLDIKFHLMARPTPDLSREVLAQAAAAGCCWISWGVESGSQRLLNLIRKGTRREHIERILTDSHNLGISNLLMMIFGLPTSTPQDLDETLEMLGNVYPYADAITASSFVLFENTPFAREPQRYQLAVNGLEVLLSINDHPIHTTRYHHQIVTPAGQLAASAGPLEIVQWLQRRRWIGPVPFTEHLPCEHLLLYSAHRQTQDNHKPISPPAPKKVA